MSITCTLGSVDLTPYLRSDPDLGTPQVQWDETGGSHADIDRQVNIRTSALVEMRLPLSVTGTSADNLVTLLDGIRDEARKATNTLTMKADTATNSVSFAVRYSPHLTQPFDHLLNYRHTAVFDLVLFREPWAYGASVNSLSAAATTLPAGVSFKSGGTAAAVLGDVAAPFNILIAPNGAEGLLHGAWLGWYPAADWTYHKVETDTSASWVGGTCAAGSTTNASGTASTKNTSTSYAYLPVPTTAANYLPGTYLVLARTSVANVAETGTFKLGSPLGDLTAEITRGYVTANVWEWIELGQVYLPAQQAYTGTTPYLWVYMKSSSGSVAVQMDCLAFVPVDAGLCRWHHTTPASTAATLRFALGECYVAGVINHTYAGGHGIKALGSGTLVAVADEPAANAATYSSLLTVSYVPRWERFR